ncbi:hypothetical protein SAMN06265379_101273 [Saccharicrinis carchari]|uniref:DNRLRE domain-containing protein n=1 Tax=Saccharicrinis carchari TaxID=1168039 RepID=A0A521AMT6_SACCC|nr:DNRLRE domain-containing protein [Saccharicrinis carchari]SMO36154.1 hypothetical protein SAMN06265379_101273 [Saccharicrinis carchari]
MKKKIRFTAGTLLMIAIIMCAFSSCEKQEEPGNDLGQLEFNFTADDLQDNLKSTFNDDDSIVSMPYQLLISVEDKDGTLVLDKEPVPIYKFSNGFISNKVELRKGTYSLTELLVVNRKGEVSYATPMEGSPLAYLVEKPLPVQFNISANAVTGLRIQVIPVGEHPPEDFGYVSFGISIVKPLTFYTAAYINNPRIMAPSRFVKAKLKIYDPAGKDYEFMLAAKVNELVVRALRGKYIFVVKTDAYEKKFMFGPEDLKMTSPENPLLLPLGDHHGIYEMEIRATPDKTADVLITNLDTNENFGEHPMFAASFKTEPVLTVMRLTRSLMHVDINSHLPKSATIVKVELTLTVTGNIYTMQASSVSDSTRPKYMGVLRQVTGEWKEEGVTWNKQPETTEANQVFIHYNPWIDFNKRTYDVTRLFVPIDKVNLPNHGFMLMHHPEDMSGGVEFGSSDTKMKDERPLFRVYYTLPH